MFSFFLQKSHTIIVVMLVGSLFLHCTPPRPVCKLGEKKCEGNKAMVCKTDGSDWDSINCASDETCTNGSCEKKTTTGNCNSGEKKCDGNKAMVCKTDGSWDSTNCASDEICTNGSCEKKTTTGNCNSGEKSVNNKCFIPGKSLSGDPCIEKSDCITHKDAPNATTCEANICKIPPAKTGETCSQKSDCITYKDAPNDTTCEANTCRLKQCSRAKETCSKDDDCCSEATAPNETKCIDLKCNQ